MKKEFMLIGVIVSLLLVSGIAGCPQKEKTEVAAGGLNVKFVKDAPPLSVRENQEFPIYINVLNEGDDYVSKGEAKFYLEGLGKEVENVKSSITNSITLSPKSDYPERLTFSDKAKFSFAYPLESLFTTPLFVTSCYDYSTTTQANLCISGINESKICSLKGNKVKSNTKVQFLSSFVLNTESFLRDEPKQKWMISIRVVFPNPFLESLSDDIDVLSARMTLKPGLNLTVRNDD